MRIDKQKVLEEIEILLNERLNNYKSQIDKIRNDIASETKSSAGDKFETGREMMKQEEQKIAKQHHELQQAIQIIAALPLHTETIQKGSLIEADRGLFYIGPSIGQLKTSYGNIMLISDQAPVYAVLKGQKKGAKVAFNSTTFDIKSVL